MAGLVGRAEDVRACEELLLAPTTRLLSLTGPGGTGKTSLAVHVADAVRPRFGGGGAVVIVDLSAIPPGEALLVWPAVSEALGIREASAESVLDVLCEALAERQVLLLLDSCEHVLELAMPLARLLAACPGVRVLATSREPLRLRWELVYPVPPLTEAAAVELFVERARAVAPRLELDGESRAVIVELCARLDGLPLAIELAAAHSRLLAPRVLLERLAQRPLFLASPVRDVAVRHRTLWATIGWSYDLLAESEQGLFRALGVFAGSFSSDAVAAIGAPQLGDDDALDALMRLADKSLIRVELDVDGQADARFRLLDTLREFARARLDEAGETDAVARRHVDYYVALAERAQPELPGADELYWLDRLDTEYPNIRAAVRWASAHGFTELALRICVALGQLWRLRGHSGEALQWLSDALTSPADAPPHLQVVALELAGRFAWAMGQRQTGQAWLRRCIALAREVGDQAELARALTELGMQEADMGHPAAARAALEESLALARERQDPFGTAQALHGLGFRAEERGELELADDLLAEAVAVRRLLGHPSGLARTLNGVGIVARARGDFSRAERVHEESLALYRQLGHTLGASYTLAYLARAVAAAGDDPRAAVLAGESLRLAWDQRNPWALAECVDVLAQLAARHGQPLTAARLFGAVEELLDGGVPASSAARAEHAAGVELAARALGPSFEAAHATGRSMPLVDVAAEAGLIPATIKAPAPQPVRESPSSILSARELEVATLVAQGLTNREIAERLVISRWTADNHVANILRKLSFGRRAEVATWLGRVSLSLTLAASMLPY